MNRIITLLIITTCLTACQSVGTIQAQSNSFTLYFMRHAEKAKIPKGDPQLIEQGVQRANNLAVMLSTIQLDKIYSTDYQRTQQTAAPTAKAQGMQVTSYNPSQLPAFAKVLLANQQTALIVGHSNTTPTLVGLTGGKAQVISESQFGDLFQVTIDKDDRSVISFKHVMVPVK